MFFFTRIPTSEIQPRFFQNLDLERERLKGEGCFAKQTFLSHEKRAPGWLGYIRDYTTQLYREFYKPL